MNEIEKFLIKISNGEDTDSSDINFRDATKEERESVDNYIRKISKETGVVWDGVVDSAIKSYENARDNYLQGYSCGKEEGMRIAAYEILDYIKLICFSKNEDIVQFRINYGSNGQRDSIINFIKDKFNI